MLQLKEGISDLKEGLAALKDTVTTLSREQTKLRGAILMTKLNMTDIQESLGDMRMEQLQIRQSLEDVKMELKQCIQNETKLQKDEILQKLSALQQTCGKVINPANKCINFKNGKQV